MNCHICSNPATEKCPICLKFFCADHGESICQTCRGRRSAGRGGRRGALVKLLNEPPVPVGHSLMVDRGISQRVIGVAEAIKHGETELTLISLELYEEGFVANFGLHDEGPRPGATALFLVRAPIYLAQATDDRGNEYQGSHRGGHERDGHWRQAQHFVPALVATARIIHVSIGEILWKGLGQGVSSTAETGPWEFDIPLE